MLLWLPLQLPFPHTAMHLADAPWSPPPSISYLAAARKIPGVVPGWGLQEQQQQQQQQQRQGGLLNSKPGIGSSCPLLLVICFVGLDSITVVICRTLAYHLGGLHHTDILGLGLKVGIAGLGGKCTPQVPQG